MESRFAKARKADLFQETEIEIEEYPEEAEEIEEQPEQEIGM